MIPLFLIAAVLGIGLATYEFSPKVHAWTDDHVRAMREALAAHHDADKHLAVVNITPDPAVAADHVLAAHLANQAAAMYTAAAGATAKTPAQRTTVAQSAGTVSARQDKIALKIAALGAGECGLHSYAGVTSAVKDKLLAKLHAEGMTVTGDNPYDIDTGMASVNLRAVWDPTANGLKLIVSSSSSWAPCSVIWSRIDPIISELILKG